MKINKLDSRIAVALAMALFIGLGMITILEFKRPPSRAEVNEMFGKSPRSVLAYEVWDGSSYMLFTNDSQDLVYFDQLKRQGMGANWGWSGVWYYMEYTKAPASLGIGYCTGELGVLPPQCKSADIFGQINDARIATLEMQIDGKWYRYAASHPGFAIRLSNFNGKPTDYRWLDNQNKVILEGRPLPCGNNSKYNSQACAVTYEK